MQGHMKFRELIKLLRKTITEREPWWAEFWSGCAAFGWSGISAMTDGSMHDLHRFRLLTEIAGEEFWEIAGLTLGFCQITVLLLASHYGRSIAAFFLAWWWAFLAVAVSVAEPATSSIALYLCYSGANLLSLAKLPKVS